MTGRAPAGVTIRPYAQSDLALLESLLGDAEAMRFLGGPEAPDALRARHARYLASDPDANALFTVLVEGVPSGWVGVWEADVGGETVWEIGWHVLRAVQGAGVATAAARLALDEARGRGRHRYADAFPALGNEASNALCRRLGFADIGETEVEYPKGRLMKARHWRLDLERAGDRP